MSPEPRERARSTGTSAPALPFFSLPRFACELLSAIHATNFGTTSGNALHALRTAKARSIERAFAC